MLDLSEHWRAECPATSLVLATRLSAAPAPASAPSLRSRPARRGSHPRCDDQNAHTLAERDRSSSFTPTHKATVSNATPKLSYHQRSLICLAVRRMARQRPDSIPSVLRIRCSLA
eukprot:6208819-Pleurochrysis_carterae.AAC.3